MLNSVHQAIFQRGARFLARINIQYGCVDQPSKDWYAGGQRLDDE
ncbi:hypothetical protein PIIN_03273 [Serendipita indica DSM 11827]|uniref:Uncharacterized protein n=1 Tax=Serendipita indica (strain DSM 11827) TaxID=1109443 RepID=G4TDH2_SERID|nr:hypothetical protein PIIN_03273 [Serendipita indica DSM 11827]